MQAFSDCLGRGFLMLVVLMYCDLLKKSLVFELELRVNTLNFAVVVKSLAIRIEKPVMQFSKNLLRRLLDAVCRLGQMGGKIQIFITFSWKCKIIHTHF